MFRTIGKLRSLELSVAKLLYYKRSSTIVTQKDVSVGPYIHIVERRRFCTNTSANITKQHELDYNDVVQLTKNNKIVLIDIREPSELQNHGVLPNSINIPSGEVITALKELSSEDFKLKYGIPKPALDSSIVFSCASGKRSLNALISAIDAGYKNAKHYQGGFNDWTTYNKH